MIVPTFRYSPKFPSNGALQLSACELPWPLAKLTARLSRPSFQVSGRLFSEPPLSSVRRSSRISAHQNAAEPSHSNGSGGGAAPGGSRHEGSHKGRQSSSQNGDRGKESGEDEEHGATSARRGRRSESREFERVSTSHSRSL
jgi:hypothetical protein